MSLTKEELEMRSTGIGASEVSALVGLDKYRGPMDIWLAKRGLVEDQEQSSAADWGNRLEPLIAAKWAEDFNTTLVKGTTVRHPVHRHVLATPDFLTSLTQEGEVLECKAPGLRQSAFWGEGDDEVPEGFIVQVQLQLAVTLRPVWHIAALIGGQDFRKYQGEADADLQAGLIYAIETFWTNHVEADIPPAVDASEATRRWLASKYPRVVKDYREATPAEIEVARAYATISKQIKELERAKDEAKAALCATIGSHQGFVAEGIMVSWSDRKAFTRPACEVAASRTLRVSVKGDDDE